METLINNDSLISETYLGIKYYNQCPICKSNQFVSGNEHSPISEKVSDKLCNKCCSNISRSIFISDIITIIIITGIIFVLLRFLFF